MFAYEWKKLLFYRKGISLICILLVLELAAVCLFTAPYDKDLEANRAVYDHYLQQAEGPLTQAKRELIEQEMLRLNTVHRQLEQVKQAYYSGQISEEEYREKFDALSEEDLKFAGFSKLYTQYIYVREQDNRYFLYTGGWEVLLGNREPDYLFLIMLVFLLTPIFCQEYGNQMDPLLLTQRKSARSIWIVKVGTALLLTAALTAVLQMYQLLYCAVRFGLPHWDYSIQSLVSFGGVKKSITLGQAYAVQFLLKEAGYLYAAVLILSISVLVRKYVLALMAGLVCLPLPFLTVSDPAAFARIPGPWGLTVGTVYLCGDGIYLSGGRMQTVSEISWGDLALLLACVGGTFCLLLLLIYLKNRNHHTKKARPAAALLLVLAAGLSGCSQEQNTVIYNSKATFWAETEDFLVLETGLDEAVLVDKQTNRLYDFPLDAFRGETGFALGSFYCRDDTVYYLYASQQYLTGGSEDPQYRNALMAFSPGSMQSSVVYQWKTDSRWFFGLLPRESWEPHIVTAHEFFIHRGKLYYLVNGQLFAMDLTTGSYASVLDMPNASNLAYDGENIYYTDQYHRLVIQNLDSDDMQVAEKVVARDFVLTPEGIWFLDMRDGGTLCYWDREADAVEKLDDTQAYALHWDPDYCWLETLDGLIRIDHNGQNKTQAQIPGFLCCMPQSDAFYTVDYEQNVLYRVDKDTLAATPVQ